MPASYSTLSLGPICSIRHLPFPWTLPDKHSCKSARRHRAAMTLCRAAIRGADSKIVEYIENHIPGAGKVTIHQGMGSSGWATSSRFDTDGAMRFFVKQARGSDQGMFQGEALGLQALYDTHTLCIPKVYHHGSNDSGTFIIMEYLDFGGRGSQSELGTALAKMHAATPQDSKAAGGKFGFAVDNTIGGTHQSNGWKDDWVEFFREQRLRPQLILAGDSEMSRLGDVLIRNLDSLFQGTEVRPCVLHGDLWSGNIGTVNGKPSVFDPAVYHGHSEAEFGMSWCAGFSSDFWRSYHEVMPKAPGFEERAKLYRLYHYLNHFNLFGSGYRSSAMSELTSLVRSMK